MAKGPSSIVQWITSDVLSLFLQRKGKFHSKVILNEKILGLGGMYNKVAGDGYVGVWRN